MPLSLGVAASDAELIQCTWHSLRHAGLGLAFNNPGYLDRYYFLTLDELLHY
eukprot:SAG11_NODE_36480_length_261_cov_0.913580_1_plen_51_part_01